MKPRINRFVRFSSIIAATVVMAASAHAADLTWDNGAATGNWNTTDANWTTASWSNATPDNAIFNTNTGTINLTEAITAGNVTFGLTNADLASALAGSTLTINGNLTTQANNNNGPGFTILSVANNVSVSGDVTINRGTLEVTSGTFNANRIGSTNAWGRLLVSGGSVTATNGVDDSILGGGVAMSVFLTGGTLSTPYIKTTSATWTALGNDGVVLNGGTLRATASSTDFIQVWDPNTWGIRNNVGIGTAGAIIDTNGFDIAINRTLNDFGGAGSLTKNGAGKLTLVWSGHSGGTTVNAGTLEYVANSGYSLLRNALTVNAGGTVSVLGDGTGLGWQPGSMVTTLNINGGTVTSPGTMHVWNIGGGVNMTGGTLQSNNGVSNANGPQLEWTNSTVNTNASTDTATIGGRIRMRADFGSGITFNVADGAAASDLLVSAAVTEASVGQGITKNGAGTMVLSGVNNYTGNTTVNEGTLKIPEGASIYNGGYNNTSVLTLNDGATLELNRWGYGPGAANQSLGGLDYNPARFVINGGTVKYTGGAGGAPTDPGEAPYGPGFTIGALGATLDSATAGDTWTVKYDNRGYGPIASNEGGTLTLTGVGNGVFDKELGGTGGVVKNGSGTWELNRTNTYTGPTTVTAGVLSLGNGTNNSNLNDSAAVTVGQAPASGAKINLNFTGADIVGSLTLDGISAGTGVFDATSHPAYFTGAGKLFVSSGPIADNDGTWASGTDGYWEIAGNWDSNTVASGIDRTATFNGALGTTVTLLTNITIGNLAFSVEDYTLAGAPLTLDASGTPAIDVASGRTAAITSNVAGSFGMEKNGQGTLVLTAANTYSGGTTVNAGTLILDGATGGVSRIIDALTVNSGATVSLTNGDTTGLGYNGGAKVTSLTINGGTVTTAGVTHIWNYSGGVDMTGGTLQSNNGVSDPNGPQMEWINADVFTNASADTATIGGRINMRADGGVTGVNFSVADGDAATDLLVSAAVTEATAGRSVTKYGEGTMVLSGVNTYTGNTVVNDGTLEVSSAGSLRFRPTSNGATNSVSGTSFGTLNFLGTVSIDLSATDATAGNSWNLVNVDSFSAHVLTPVAVTSTLGAFTEVTTGTWELAATGAKWVFTVADGNLAYVNNASPFETWGSTYGLSTGDEGGDLDNDGLTNFQEFAFGLIPNDGSSVNPITSQLNPTSGEFTYQRLKDSGLTYTIWTSTDLVTWTEDTTAGQAPTVVGDNESVVVTLTGPLPASKLFIRVKAE